MSEVSEEWCIKTHPTYFVAEQRPAHGRRTHVAGLRTTCAWWQRVWLGGKPSKDVGC